MKPILLAAVLSVAAVPVLAGGMAEPVTEPEVIVQDTSSSGGDNWVGILLLLAVVTAVASD